MVKKKITVKPVDPLKVEDITLEPPESRTIHVNDSETIEEHCRRLGVFSPGEVAMLVTVGASHAKIEQLAENKAAVPAPEPE